MQEQIFIPRSNNLAEGENYDFLYEEGLKLIAKISSDKWSDYNLHDPGMTILEVVCYALTELGYKSAFPVADILTQKNGKINLAQSGLYTAAQVMHTTPVTLNDYRKYIIDASPYIQNVWLTPDPSTSTFKVALLLDDHTPDDYEVRVAVLDQFRYAHTIGEQLQWPEVLQKEMLAFMLDISLERGSRVEEVVAEVLYNISSSLTPQVHFHTLSEMQEAGFLTDDIFEGPALRHGFIKDEELQAQPGMIEITEIIRLIRSTPGVISVNDIKIDTDTINNTDVFEGGAMFRAQDGYIIALDIPTTLKNLKVRIDGNEVMILSGSVDSYYSQMESAKNRTFRLNPEKNTNDLPPPVGNWRHLSDWYSIQHNFPRVYGIGEEQLAKTVSEQRKAQAAQLKAYLLFFEQVMANFLGQLGNLSSVYSVLPQDSMYFFNPLYTVPHVAPLLSPFAAFMEEYKKIPLPILPRADVWDVYRNRADNNYITAGTEALRQSENFSQRRNDILDFMLSLYNEQLPIFSPSGTYQPAGGNEDISIKEDYLARYPMLSMSRGIAGSFNGLGGPEENLRALLNIPDRPESPIYNLISSVFTIRMVPSGMSADDARAATGSPYSFVGNNTSIYEFFQLAVHDISYQTVEEGKEKATGLSLEVNGKPIEMFTNMATVKAYAEVRSFQQKLIKFSNEAENFYVIDHSDLDYKQDNTTLEHAEFYRYRMSYIFPGFTLRFGEEAYRNYVESLIFQYTPAHIRPYVYWLEFDQLRDFEQYYYALKAVVTTDSTGDGEMEKAEALGLFLYGLYVASPVYQPNS